MQSIGRLSSFEEGNPSGRYLELNEEAVFSIIYKRNGRSL